MGFLR
jgi:hypothetical protein